MLNPAPANAPTTPPLLAAADILTPNETEFAALLARHCAVTVQPDDVASLPDAALHALCRVLARDASVVVTLGAQGAFVSHPESATRGDASAFYRVAATAVQVVDTTGAGDAFNGALAAQLALAPGPFADAVAFASRYAGLSTEHAGGAASMPRLPRRAGQA
jgi:ribokinase